MQHIARDSPPYVPLGHGALTKAYVPRNFHHTTHTTLMKCKYLSLLLLGSALQPLIPSAPAQETLRREFLNPPDSSRPRTWWHWMDDKVTKEGITKDLEAMKAIGLKGAHITNIDHGGLPDRTYGNACVLTPHWLDLVEHAAKECQRLGLQLGMSSASGCSGSGGPWITPELSMQEIVWSTTHVVGGSLQTIALPQPRTNHEFYRDVAVLAFPALEGDGTPVMALQPKITSSVEGVDWSRALDGNLKTSVSLPALKEPGKYGITMEFPQPVALRSLNLHYFETEKDLNAVLSASDDGQTWRAVVGSRRWQSEVHPGEVELIDGYPEQKARFVRVELEGVHRGFTLHELNFQSARIPGIHVKASRMRSSPATSQPSNLTVTDSQRIAPDKIISLTASLLPGGVLQTTLPEGRWTILRFGHTTNGNEIKPVTERSAGLEVDKFCAEALQFHFDNGMLGQVKNRLGPLFGTVFKDVNVDSWEAGCQTWTAKFPQEFNARRGYDITQWLPALTGRVVGQVQETDRFLWDYRRTISDLINHNFFGAFRTILNRHGVLLEAEAPGIGMPIPIDQIQSLGMLDIPQGEFWLGGTLNPGDPPYAKGGQDNTKEPASAAHVYGKPVVSCEAFTSFGKDDGWTQHPFRLKPYGDKQFCNGLNEIVFHRFAHQPDDRVPGMSLGQFGLNFDRTLTWWSQGRAWVDYLTRCQHVLRQGRFHADVLYYYGRDVPASAGYFVPDAMEPRQSMKPVLPSGYDYDVCDASIFQQATVEQGEIALPSGMRYRYLVLPDHGRLLPEDMKHVRRLAEAGATLIGPQPKRSPSLAGFPQADQAVTALAIDIWPPAQSPGTRAVGKGRIISGKSFEQILSEDGLAPDFVAHGAADAQIPFIHRILPEGNVYYACNLQNRDEPVTLQFRTTGRALSIWDPTTGRMTDHVAVKDDGATTSVTLTFQPHESLFFVFTHATKQTGAAVTFRESRPSTTTPVDGPWTVLFPANLGAPTEPIPFQKLVSWTEHPDDRIKYFSGTASYRKTWSLEAPPKNQTLWLDLGTVPHVAEVFLNNQPLGVVWTKPARVNITHAVVAGPNELEIRVTNVWKNRMVGDAKLAPTQRVTWSNWPFYNGTEPLEVSGLLGPVTLIRED
jgi:hypothetical protein